MLVRIANREDPNQTASDLGLHCFLDLFCSQLVFEIIDHLPYSYIYLLYQHLRKVCYSKYALNYYLIKTEIGNNLPLFTGTRLTTRWSACW